MSFRQKNNHRGHRSQSQQHGGWRSRHSEDSYGEFTNPRNSQTFHGQEEKREEDHSTSRQRHPPGLKGKEIGLWYARRNKTRTKEQKQEKPTVSIDKQKERDLRHLLHNLQSEDTQPSTSTDSLRSKKETPFDEDVAVKAEPPDHWESLYNQDADRGHASGFRATFIEVTRPSRVTSHTDTLQIQGFGKTRTPKNRQGGAHIPKEELIEVEDSGDEEQKVPSVMGVVDYLKNHSDYPYCDNGLNSSEVDSVVVDDDPVLSRRLFEDMQSLKRNPNYKDMLNFRRKLPSFAMKDKIVSTVRENQVLVISGETGCGKTTQVPQFILDDFIEQGQGAQCRIICTQPRRISAISVAERVGAERCERVDDHRRASVGYQIRLEMKRPRPVGSILFCTTGIVLKFLEGDPYLRQATHIVLDEIHERDLQSDFLMIILKDLLPKRPDLKVILMSATLNANMFSKYFADCPMLNIPGFTFPVKEYFLEDVIEMTRFDNRDGERRNRPRKRLTRSELQENEDYQVWCRNLMGSYSHRTIQTVQDFDTSFINFDLVQAIVNHICTRMEDGAILIFVPGWEDIKKLHDIIRQTVRCKSGRIKVLPLHSQLPTINQREVFERPPPGDRKIIIATNIAETSITIDDVVFVIDCGKIKVKGFQPEMNLSCLESVWVSKANSKQRRGRAGRVQAGHCFHLFTRFRYDLLLESHPPEMLRTRLEELCLQIKLLHLGRIVPFISKAMEHPSMDAINHAINTLRELNALDEDENLLPLGYHLARMPVEPHTGKMILFGAMFCCLDPILTVASSLSFKDAFNYPIGKEEETDRTRFRLAQDSKSDHIMLINSYRGWEQSLRNRTNWRYCNENFLSENTLQMLKGMKSQLAELLFDLGFVATKDPKDVKANVNSANLPLIRAVLCAGLYPSVALITKVPKSFQSNNGVAMEIKDGSRVHVHPKSVNMKQTFFESKWMVFYHKLKTSKVYIHDCTMVSPYALLFFGGKIEFVQEEGHGLVCVDGWIKFKASASTAQLVKDLRVQLDRLLEHKIKTPGPTKWDHREPEGRLLAAIADLIAVQDEEYSISGSTIQGSIGRKS